MTKYTPRLSKPILAQAARLVMFTLLFACFGAGAALAQTRAYVTNSHDNTVSVIDTATASVITTVPVGSSPDEVAVTPNGRFVYVANQLGNTVSVIDAASNTVIATVPVAVFPGDIDIAPNGAFAYVTSSPADSISVIDTATNTVVNTIPATSPNTLTLAPSGNLAYLTHGVFVNGVTVVNIATNSVVANIPVPADTTIAAAITPDGAFLYVTCLSFATRSSKLAVIDTATNTVVAIVPLPGTFAPGVAITPNGASAYVANNGGGVCCGGGGGVSSISVIDTATNTLVANFFGGLSPNGIAATPDGAFVYVTDLFTNSVSVISTANDSVVEIVPVGLFPAHVAFGTLTDIPEPDPIESLIDQVEALIAAGALSQNQGDGLLDKIHEARAKIDAGQTAAACNQLSSFINQVNAFISNGTLTPAEGQPLIDTANVIKTNAGC